MKPVETRLPGCRVLEPKVFSDERGSFYETWNQQAFSELGLDLEFKQANVSSSSRGILRGLHYQWAKSQGKLVHVLDGKVYDIAVNIRQDSSTYGCWASAILSAENKRQMWIPPGFVTLSERATFISNCMMPNAMPTCAGMMLGWPLTGP